ncbi:MAG: rRNA maturation RNase YbeY [Sedimentisphaerales bacterium]|nr:rRNA maturation RNase YbeY [Sedimentisphaerales bacterium]
MGINIEIANCQDSLEADAEQLRATAAAVLRDCGVDSAQVSIALVDDAVIRELENRYHGIDEATDVLSFDMRDEPNEKSNPSGESDLEGESESAGESEQVPEMDCEIVINAQRALSVAQSGGYEPLAELNLYLVHGLLHQLGFDDRTAAQAEMMHKKEDQLLNQRGFGDVFYRGNKE